MGGGDIQVSAHHYIGTSGWHYDHWRHLFYPEELPKTKWLEFNDAEAFAIRKATTLRGYLEKAD